MADALILGIESSCDETAAAVVRSGEQVLSNAVASQIGTHAAYGGVVPELASREHLKAIVPVTRKALADARLRLEQIDAVAVTRGPGLPGALLVGIAYAKALAFALAKPVIAVNHLEGHIHAVLLEERARGADGLQFPLLALVVSGGHTHLYLAEEHGAQWRYRNVGRTLDDAAGEAFDKVAKLLGLGYPGGPIIDRLAPFGDPGAVPLPMPQIKPKPYRPRPTDAEPRFDFSFSGLKTAVLRYVELHDMRPRIAQRAAALRSKAAPSLDDVRDACDPETLNLIASFQRTVVADLVRRTTAAVEAFGARTVFVSGGVAANGELRRRFEEEAHRYGFAVAFPSPRLSTDNAAMIAAAAYPKYLAGEFAPLDFTAEAGMALGGRPG